MHLIVGLGNPGAKYLFNRHNIGFMSIDHFSRTCGTPPSKEEHKALVQKFKLDGQDVILARPQTFMNHSGESVQALMHYYKIELDHLLVVHDDIDQAFGSMKFQKNRGHGGQNGVRDIHEKLATEDYARLKLGIGRPAHPNMDVAAYVLQNFSKDQEALLNEILDTASNAIESFIFEGLTKATNQFNKTIELKTNP